jgi:hypothetical protein
VVEVQSMPQEKNIVLTILPYDGDIAAARRVRTILDLAITIAKREDLRGINLRNTQNKAEQLITEKEKKQNGNQGCVRNYQAATVRENQVRDKEGK